MNCTWLGASKTNCGISPVRSKYSRAINEFILFNLLKDIWNESVASLSSYEWTVDFTPTEVGDYYFRPKSTYTQTTGDQLTDSWDWPSQISFRVVNNTSPYINQDTVIKN